VLIIIHSETNKSNIQQYLGRPEYSYYFVLKEFRPVLERLGRVIEVSNPDELVDRLYFDCLSRGEDCVFLSFSPPHRTPVHYACPTIPVFAWEFSTIPTESWQGEPRHDWRTVLCASGTAITHSSFTVNAVRDVMGPDYPISAIAAPVWDRFAARGELLEKRPVVGSTRLNLRGLLIDSRTTDLRPYGPERLREGTPIAFDQPPRDCELLLEGVVYTSVFNPYDGRKNWKDMISAFCTAFRDTPDATLVLKLTHHDIANALNDMLHHVYKNQSYLCRIVLIHGYLSDIDYERLVEATCYVVNCSYGEGQCLPLMEFMSCGKPAIAPLNTAMADYIDRDNAFIVEGTDELTSWPHDPRAAYRTLRYVTDWDSLCTAFSTSHDVARQDVERYQQMSAHAVRSLQAFCSQAVAEQRLKAVFEQLLQRREANRAQASGT
jgi:glycosyltransferase involved in cell wall biosynthesis